jgi:hypothetical protein
LQRLKNLIGCIAQNATQTWTSDPWKIREICSRAVRLLKRAAFNAVFIVALAAIAAWLVFTPLQLF